MSIWFVCKQNSTSVQCLGFDVNLIFISNQNSTSLQFLGFDVSLIFISNQKSTSVQCLGFDVYSIFVSNQNSMSAQCCRLTSSKHCILTSSWFSFPNKIKLLSSVGLNVKSTLTFDCNPIFIFNQSLLSVQCWRLTSSQCWDLTSIRFLQPKFNICTMLEAGIRPALGFDVNQIFTSNQNLTSVHFGGNFKPTLGFDVNLFLFPTKFQRLSNFGDFLSPEADVKRTLCFDVNPIVISNQNSTCSMLEVNVKPKLEVDINPMLGFNINLIFISNKNSSLSYFGLFWLQPDFHF